MDCQLKFRIQRGSAQVGGNAPICREEVEQVREYVCSLQSRRRNKIELVQRQRMVTNVILKWLNAVKADIGKSARASPVPNIIFERKRPIALLKVE